MVTVGLEVPHAHVHLIPINAAEDLHFTNPKLQLTTAEFQQIQALIRSKL
jgi:histidine triad (HIT) family protein